MPEVTVVLTPDQISFFHQEGYLALDALTTPDEVGWLRDVYDRMFAERRGREAGDQFDLAGTDEEGKEAALPQILQPAKYAPELNDSKLKVNATAVARQLLGPKAEANFAHAIYKPPRTGAATPWHQDAAYWNPAWIHRSISIWVPLQEATPENGCMQFVPRSHELDVIEHRSINDDPRIHGLELTQAAMRHVTDPVVCPLPPGGATIHGGYMLHMTQANRSNVPRRALILMAGVGGLQRKPPRTFPWLDRQRTARAQRAAQVQGGGA